VTIEDLVQDVTSTRWADPAAFAEAAAAVLRYQRSQNAVYDRFCQSSTAWTAWAEAPHLPVEAFKHVPVTTFPPADADHVFESSGTGRGVPSKHYVRRLDLYQRVVTVHFERVFGTGPFTFVAHLPGYAESGSRSSLLYMVDVLIRRYGDAASGFFLDDPSLLDAALDHCARRDTQLLLFGAAFGLLDLLEARPVALPAESIVIETGGMKTYRREMDRDELHDRLASGFGIAGDRVFSEYGMCELMSQCYTRGDHVFYPPPWMRFRVVDPERPTREVPEGASGALALFDLANVYTASALLTEDRAIRVGNGFRVLGRLSDAELRGCNFLVESDAS
jgi:hypothetical protein